MNRIWYIAIGLFLIFTLIFFLVNWLQIPLLNNPEYLKEEDGLIVLLISLFLLTSDLLLPVPGSVIMMGNGAVFGIVLGTGISLIGTMFSSILGYIIGSRFKKLAYRLISDSDYRHGKSVMDKYGQLAIIASRPVPLMSETVIIISGMLGYRVPKMIMASFIGLLPASFIYALIGASLIDSDYSIFSLLIVLIFSGLMWVIGVFWSRKQKGRKISKI
ncbi:MAG: VTT domain-containing protein [Cyclobacteriaceae bacterium]|nr:VTT domain-containing protein [Cyclobacteriaceae bacterium]